MLLHLINPTPLYSPATYSCTVFVNMTLTVQLTPYLLHISWQSNQVSEYLNHNHPTCCIGRFESHARAVRSPDLMPLDYFLWEQHNYCSKLSSLWITYMKWFSYPKGNIFCIDFFLLWYYLTQIYCHVVQ